MFTVNHALSCKKGGFVAQRHDTIRDHLTSHISKVCRNVETEPLLQPLDNEVFNLPSTVTSRQARLDVKAGGFWTPGVTAFFDVRVTHVKSRSNQGKYTATILNLGLELGASELQVQRSNHSATLPPNLNTFIDINILSLTRPFCRFIHPLCKKENYVGKAHCRITIENAFLLSRIIT